MSDKIKPVEVDTSENAQRPKGEPGLPVKIPLSILRWFIYSLLFIAPLAMWYPRLVGWDGLVGTCLILGHFASQLNALIKK